MSGKFKAFFNSTDKKLLGLALAFIVVSLYYLLVDETLFGLLGSGEEDSNRPVVGTISSLENDTRHKSKTSFRYAKARVSQQVRLGDSVFTGAASKSRVDLADGGHVEMDENTLINFDDVRGFKVPNLKMGNFKLSVNGTMKVMIGDELTEIKGNGSEVEVKLSENKKPEVKVTKGEASVTGAMAVAKKEPPTTTTTLPKVAEPPPPPPVVEKPKPEFKPVAQQTPYVHTDQLYDFYEKTDTALKKRRERRAQVDFPVPLQWGLNTPVERIYGQVSQTPGFEKSVQFFETSEQNGHSFHPVYLGTNYWRVSVDRTNWSQVEWFQVESQPLQVKAPELVLAKESVYIMDSRVEVKGDIQASDDLKAFVIEMSPNAQFQADQVVVHWTARKDVSFNLKRAGEMYFRARGVTDRLEVTPPGPIAKLVIVRPLRAAAPKLAKNQIQVYEYDKVDLSWEKSDLAKSYDVEIVGPAGQLMKAESTKNPEYRWKGGPKGIYQARIFAKDKFGRRSEDAAATEVTVIPKPVIAKKQPPKEVRKPAAENVSATKIEDPRIPFMNRNYPSSKFELQGAGFTMYSSEQVSQSKEQPLAITLGLRLQQWKGSHGYEGAIRTKVMGVNKTSSEAAPMTAEVRYNYRWKLYWNAFSKLKESQIAAILGYELYRNQSSGTIFTPNYDLFKVGFSLAFPMFERWDTGGEVLYGQGMDASTKYEIAGWLNYYVRSDWSAGVGYRLHLFQAGSKDSAPASGLPYREGYGEAYSVLRWHY